MGMLNRSAVVIRPLPPYLNWARHDDTTDIAERVFEDLRTAPHVYLLPDFEDAESAREAGRLLAGAVRGDVELLANRRAGRRTVRARCFKSGFDVQMCPVIEDLHVDEELVELDD